jgi:hypothetical protein
VSIEYTLHTYQQQRVDAQMALACETRGEHWKDVHRAIVRACDVEIAKITGAPAPIG